MNWKVDTAWSFSTVSRNRALNFFLDAVPAFLVTLPTLNSQPHLTVAQCPLKIDLILVFDRVLDPMEFLEARHRPVSRIGV
jgi:hypothetical protein